MKLNPDGRSMTDIILSGYIGWVNVRGPPTPQKLLRIIVQYNPDEN